MGYDPEGKKLDAEVLRKYIYGGHVAEYMTELQVRHEAGRQAADSSPAACGD